MGVQKSRKSTRFTKSSLLVRNHKSSHKLAQIQLLYRTYKKHAFKHTKIFNIAPNTSTRSSFFNH